MTLPTKYWIGIAVAAGIVAGLYVILDRDHTPAPTDTVIDLDITGDATITELPSEPIAPQPSLDRSLTFEGGSLPPEAQEIVRAKINELVALLKADPADLSHWIQLGVYRKQAGDYEGARLAWAYVHVLAPTDAVSVVNLADLSMNFTKDYPKAEQYYRAAIAINPHHIDNYRNLYTLYRYLYKTDTSAAADIIKEGLKNNPGNPDLLVLQAEEAAPQPQ